MQFSSLQTLLAKELTRKQFLLYVGALLLALTGLSSLFKTIVNPHSRSEGFGSGPYGGIKK